MIPSPPAGSVRQRVRPARHAAASSSWAAPKQSESPRVDVLIPTRDRPTELGITLAGLAAQDGVPFRIFVSDQSDGPADFEPEAVATMVRLLEAQGRRVRLRRHPRRGIAEHRQFLFEQASAPLVLFLDDDVWLEPGALALLVQAIDELGCGFVGFPVQGLSYLHDERDAELAPFEPIVGTADPEPIGFDAPGYRRWTLHNAANPTHLAARLGLGDDQWLAYRVAWVGGCVLYRRSALSNVGGFGFWHDLPADHAGEDVVAQWRVMARFGGAGILPSAAVHLEAPTTLPVRDADARQLVDGAR